MRRHPSTGSSITVPAREVDGSPMNEVATPKRTKSVFIVQRSSSLDGSAYSGLLLANGLREAGWDTHVAFGHEGPIIEQYASAGHVTYVVPHENWLRRGQTHQFLKDGWLEWRKARSFSALIREIAPDVVYLNTIVSLSGAIAARQSNVPCVWHLREMFSDVGGEMHAPSWAIPLVRWVVRTHADRLVANSEATAHNLLGNYAGEVTIVPNAVRSAFFEEDRTREEARAALGLDPAELIIGVPGTLRPMKGHPFFLNSVAPLLHERGNLRVAITGEGASDFAARMKEKIRCLGIGEQVKFLGWVEDMPAFYRACDLVCIPSRAEPFGRTAIEAFAVETPVVASSVGGLETIVTDKETGLLVPYGEESALSDTLRCLLDAPELRRELAQNARQAAEKNYHEQVYKRRIEALVEGACTHGHSLSRT